MEGRTVPAGEGLVAFCAELIEQDPPAYERALARYAHHDRRFVDDGPIRTRFLAVLERVARRLAEAPEASAHLLGASPQTLASLIEALQALGQEQPRQEEAFQRQGLLPELLTLIAQRLGLFREEYLELVARLPERFGYSPRYLNFGPSGRCNLRCRDCILWGALFQNPLARGLADAQVLRHLDDAEELGVHGLSFCIGEPTVNLDLLDRVLRRIQSSPTLQARSFVTNGLFARQPERARAVWRRILDALGPEKTVACTFAISSNPELAAQGVLPEHAVNAVEAFQEVMPNGEVLVQLIRDEGYASSQQQLLDLLFDRGLLSRMPDLQGGRTLVRRVRLSQGTDLVFSVMAKMPAINSPTAEQEYDPYVFYVDPESIATHPLPGIFMRTNSDPLDEEQAQDAARIALGPDGLFYLDYHFMVRQVRPLGQTLPEALASFRKDPLLHLLTQIGGLNRALALYDALPPDERPLPDLLATIGRYSTVSMVAANVLYGDEDLARRLLERLLAPEPGGPTGGDPAPGRPGRIDGGPA